MVASIVETVVRSKFGLVSWFVISQQSIYIALVIFYRNASRMIKYLGKEEEEKQPLMKKVGKEWEERVDRRNYPIALLPMGHPYKVVTW
jgi:hypothetical protein